MTMESRSQPMPTARCDPVPKMPMLVPNTANTVATAVQMATANLCTSIESVAKV